jgi:guanosine-3',5'-bis(diphosphate) 3'-pyrophosphohydrolase
MRAGTPMDRVAVRHTRCGGQGEGWGGGYSARIVVKSRREAGSLACVTQEIAENDGNIDKLSMQRKTADYTDVVIGLEVWDLKRLNAIIGVIGSLPIAAEAVRVFE